MACNSPATRFARAVNCRQRGIPRDADRSQPSTKSTKPIYEITKPPGSRHRCKKSVLLDRHRAHGSLQRFGH